MEPVVTVWPITGPPLRTRRNRPVFTFRIVKDEPLKRMSHCWLANPLPPFPGGVNVTSAPGLEALLVRASPRFVRTVTVVEGSQAVHRVVLFSLGFRIAADPEESLLGVPR